MTTSVTEQLKKEWIRVEDSLGPRKSRRELAEYYGLTVAKVRYWTDEAQRQRMLKYGIERRAKNK